MFLEMSVYRVAREIVDFEIAYSTGPDTPIEVYESEKNKWVAVLFDAIHRGELPATSEREDRPSFVELAPQPGEAIIIDDYDALNALLDRMGGTDFRFPSTAAINENVRAWQTWIKEREDAAEARRKKLNMLTLGDAAIGLATVEELDGEALISQMEEAAQRGELRIFSPSTFLSYRPSEVRAWFDLTTINEIDKWLKAIDAPYHFPVKSPEPPSDSSSSPENGHWKMTIQAEAAARWKRLRNSGANPTKNSIKDDLANWARASGIKTPYGNNPSPEYIYRHVLRDWTPPDD